MGYFSIAIVIWSLSSNIDQGAYAYVSKDEQAVKFGPYYHTGHMNLFPMSSAEARYHADQVGHKISIYRQICSDANMEPNDLLIDVWWNTRQVFGNLAVAKDKSRSIEDRVSSMHLLRMNLEYYSAWGFENLFWHGTIPGY